MSRSISVVVPTHRRPEALRRCLEGLARQATPPSEVVVVHARDDRETPAVIEAHVGARGVVIERASLVEAMSVGAGATSGDAVCFTDDDAVPRPDWLARIGAAFADPSIGAVGGRDAQCGAQPDPGAVVGRLGRWGKLRGNHHVGAGAPRDVDVLKGVNMAFRRAALALPTTLRGSGAETHSEVAICLWARARGWRVVYDPSVVVDHAVAPRVAGDERAPVAFAAARDVAFNLTSAILWLRPDLRVRRPIYGVLVGDRGCPGLATSAARLAMGDASLVRRLIPTLVGTAAAIGRFLRHGPFVMVPIEAPRAAPPAAPRSARA